jgi:formyl-CoA transferase
MDAVRATPQTEPAISVPGMGDHPTAMALYAAIATALYKRERTGKGSVVQTSLLANGLWSNSCYMQAVLCEADMSVRLQRGMRGALTEIYACKDGRWFMLALINQQREWPLLLECLGKQEWAADPRYLTPIDRRTNAPTLLRELEQIFLTRNWLEWRAMFVKAGITFGPIAKPEDHLECPQVAANNFLPEFADQPGLRTVDSPIRIAGETKQRPQMAPGTGQHTRQVLAECGITPAEIDAMIAAGAAA